MPGNEEKKRKGRNLSWPVSLHDELKVKDSFLFRELNVCPLAVTYLEPFYFRLTWGSSVAAGTGRMMKNGVRCWKLRESASWAFGCSSTPLSSRDDRRVSWKDQKILLATLRIFISLDNNWRLVFVVCKVRRSNQQAGGNYFAFNMKSLERDRAINWIDRRICISQNFNW